MCIRDSHGGLSIAHNGNLTNAITLRTDLVKNGSIFRTTSDTETIVQLIAQSKREKILDKITEALFKIQGGYALVALTNKKLIGIRDPHGIRPLVIGKLNKSYVLASETCAFDIIGAKFIREVENGEIVIISSKGLESIKPLIRVMEAGLLLIIVTHVVNAVYLTFSNKKAAANRYSVDASATSSVNSRTMIISGTIILLFFIIHLRYIWFTYQAHLFLNESETYYDVLLRNQIGYLGHLPTAIFYIIAILFIASHLKHGVQSALKTFGLTENSKWKILYSGSVLIWGVIPMAFISIIISIQLGIIK